MKSSTPPSTNPTDRKIDFTLAGPAALRQAFYPRVRLFESEVLQVLGIARSTFHRAFKVKEHPIIKVRKDLDVSSRPYVLLEDLIEYLFGPQAPPPHICNPIGTGRKRGRPRKGEERGAASALRGLEGGAK